MRLICPECNALYDVPGEMIPPEGREVECSACGHVWFQATDLHQMRGLASDLRGAGANPPAPAAGQEVDLGAAPVLRRPLPDDVLSILREETARELSARRAARGDASPAGIDPAAPVATVAAPVAVSPVPDSSAPASAPPVSPVPDAIVVAGPADTDSPAAPVPPAPASVIVDWPATTVTAPDDSPPRMVARSSPAAVSKPLPRPILAAAPRDSRAGDAGLPASDEMPPPPRRRVPKTLPDVERLAATLQTQFPPEPAATLAPAPAPRRARRHGYRAGFGRSLGVAAALLAAYLAGVIWVGTGRAPAPVIAMVAGVDAARAGLRDAANTLIDRPAETE